MALRKLVAYDTNKLYVPQPGDTYLATEPVVFMDDLSVDTINSQNFTIEVLNKCNYLSITGVADIDAMATITSFLTVTQPVDLDAIETRVNALDASVVLKGIWDASTGSFPVSDSAGESWICSVSGTVNGVAFKVNDRLIALVDSASIGTYTSQWYKAAYTADVISVAGRTGSIVLTEADISDLQDYLVAADINDLEAVTVGLTALAGGGQSSATPLYEGINVANIVATAGDSFLLPVAVAGMSVPFRNNGAAAANIFPQIASKINSLSENVAISVPVDGSVVLKAYNATSWFEA